MSLSLRLIKNTFSLLASGLIDKLANFLFIAVIVRKLSQSEFGAYSLLLMLFFLGGMLANLGVGNVIIREVAKNREDAKSLFNNALIITLILSSLIWPCMRGVALLLNYDPEVVSLISYGGAIFIFMGIGQISSSILNGYERMDIFALAGSINSVMGLGLGILVLWLGGGIASLVFVLMFTEGLKASILTFIVHRYFVPLEWHFEKTVIIHILQKAAPFALLMAYGVLLRRIDLLLMGWLSPLEDVAVYSATAKITDLLALFSGSMVGALFPAFSVILSSTHLKVLRLYEDSLAVFAVLGFGAVFSILILAEPILLFLFGETYIKGSTALCWLSGSYFFIVLSGPVGTLLVAAGDQMYRLLIMCIVVLSCNVVLNLWLIPILSYNGAAIATLVSSFLGFIGRLLLSRTFFGQLPNFFACIWRAFVASVVMAIVLNLLDGLHILPLIIIGALVYGFFLAVLGEFRQPRYKTFRKKLVTLLGKPTDP